MTSQHTTLRSQEQQAWALPQREAHKGEGVQVQALPRDLLLHKLVHLIGQAGAHAANVTLGLVGLCSPRHGTRRRNHHMHTAHTTHYTLLGRIHTMVTVGAW